MHGGTGSSRTGEDMKNVRQLWVLIPMIGLIVADIAVVGPWSLRRMTVGALLVVLLNLAPLLAFSLSDALKNPTRGVWAGLFRASFHAYLFMVLALTVYWVDFGGLSLRGSAWLETWRSFSLRGNNVNFHPFRVFRDYGTPLDPQILGNFVMLMPLGIYLPALFPKVGGFMKALLAGLAFTISIELTQLVITCLLPLGAAAVVRSIDIDDVILNTAGYVFGYLMYRGARGGGGGGRR